MNKEALNTRQFMYKETFKSSLKMQKIQYVLYIFLKMIRSF